MKSASRAYLGFDIGASSGRASVGVLENGCLYLHQISRFSNGYIELDGTLYWNFLDLWSNVVVSMRSCSQAGYDKLNGIAVDTWGVDYGLIGSGGKLIGQPICYRDSSAASMMEIIASKISREQIYRITGIHLWPIASLPQLLAIKIGPGQDGFDYCFQADYIEAWKWMTEGLIECAAHNSKVKVLVEYKPKEPRTHCFVSHVGKVLLLFKGHSEYRGTTGLGARVGRWGEHS